MIYRLTETRHRLGPAGHEAGYGPKFSRLSGPLAFVSGFDRRVLESAFRLGEALGLTMAGSLQKPVRLDELEIMLGRLRAGIGA